ncbi:MAG: hypothetical protein LBD98_03290 [Endomicrobium sp.]|jgi:hypothetical protein|nr:hypothetical protein [Endomicrobium sp.]MDR2251835.1 hypothetical protein [Endomicrobium sp.]MDR2818570.1 hypothetical protein [Endomicrobium sp.]
MKIKASLILSLILLLSGFTYAASWNSTKEGAKKAWDYTRTGFARFGNGTKVFYCTLVTSDLCTNANVTKSWYCPILQTIRLNSCTSILEEERSKDEFSRKATITVNNNDVQEELGENEVDANKKNSIISNGQNVQEEVIQTEL